jgi:uncharacterized protein
MLIQFSIKNFRTFKERASLSLIASNYDQGTREKENIINDDKFHLRILKSAVVYGANASGKSKFIEALMFMKRFVVSSSKESQKGDPIKVEPFRLSVETENKGSEFEIIFVHNKFMYRYGFEVDKERVISEWLYCKQKIKEIELFYRNYQSFDIHPRSFSKGSTLVREGLIRDNALLLSVAAQFNEPSSISVMEWFKSVRTISGLREEAYEAYTMGRTEKPEHKKEILKLLKAADLGIQDIVLKKLDIQNLPKDMPKELKEIIEEKSKDEGAQFVSDILTAHRKYDSNNKTIGKVDFSMEEDESSGTGKFFALTGPILNSLENGDPLIVDELDSKLHPNLVCKIVALFNSKDLNPKNAQLIFNTHDTNLLSSGLFRRDQIWFTEKDKFGAAKIYSLADFKSDAVRKDELFEENYIRGKYGATPLLSFFDSIIENENLVVK